MKILEKLGIYGWKIEDENLVLASLLTGDPLLMIGSHGSAKTHVGCKVAQALGKRFLSYDASKALFEDVLGFPNVESLKAGKVEYVPSAVTIWDKQFVLIDEINRALPELQAKWLEIIRSRKIMGYPTAVKWVWAAMNPMNSSYNGTQAMDAALVGRFATFLYPPEALDMEEDDRIRVVEHINGDDAPGVGQWGKGSDTKTVDHAATAETGRMTVRLLERAAAHLAALQRHFSTMGELLSRLSVLVLEETRGEVKLDGRRLGFIYRNLLAVRAIEMARSDEFGEDLPAFAKTAEKAVIAGIPVGINDDGINREEVLHKVEVCLDLLADYFNDGSDLRRTEVIYRLFTCSDLLEKTRILLRENLTELARSKAWNDLAESEQDISVLAYKALQVEARKPGTVPNELLEKLSGRVAFSSLNTDSIPVLRDEAVEHIDQVERILAQPTDIRRIIAYQRVRELAQKAEIDESAIRDLKSRIEEDATEIEKLLGVQTAA